MNMLRRMITVCAVCSIVLGTMPAEAKGPRVLLNAVLAPAAGAPAAVKGKAKYDNSTSRTNMSVEGENLRTLNGQTAVIFLNGSQIGTAPIALGRFKLERTTERGGSVPAIKAGDKIEVVVNLKTILTGTFR